MSQSKGPDFEQLVSEKKILEELLSVREQTVQEQSQKLSEILGELHARASELEFSQEELARQSQIFQSILNSLTVGVVVANSAGQLILFNPAAEELLGVGLTETSPEDWALCYGCYLPDGHTPYTMQELPLFRALRGETLHGVEMFIRNPKKTGGVLISVSANPVIDRSEKNLGAVAVFYDITERRQMEELLRKSERQYEDLFLGAADPIVILDKSGRIQGMNPAVEKTAGYNQNDLLGKHFNQLKIITPSALPKAIQQFTRVVMGHETSPFELEIISKTGAILFFEANARRIRKGGEVDAVQVIFRDMTSRKKSERKLAVQHGVTRVLSEAIEMDEVTYRILESIGETLGWDFGAVWKVDAEQQILKCFQVWQPGIFFPEFKEISLKSSFAPGQGFPGFVWARGEAVWTPDLSQGNEIPRFEESLPAAVRSGFGFPIKVSGRVMGIVEFFGRQLETPDESMLQMLDSIGSQIGQFLERKKTEQALILKHVELAKAQAEREQLEIFAYVASHDLQEPLQKILAYSEFIKTGMPEGTSPKIMEYLEKLQLSSLRMSGLTTDLMKYMKASSKSGTTDWVSITSVAGQVLKEMDDEIKAAGARIECGPLPILKADVRQMHQLLQNLISNAIKFRQKNTPLHVIISSRDSDPGYVEVMVQDNGIGFDEKHAEQIFKPFEKLHKASDYPGSGIGLAICRKIIERHRGSIHVQSREGQGAVFFIKMPIA